MARQKKTKKAPKIKKQETTQNNGFKDEIWLLIILALALLLFVSIFTEGAGLIGRTINTLVFGLIGTTAYILPIFMVALILFRLVNKKNTMAKRKILFASLLLGVFTIIIQLIQGNVGSLLKELPQHFTFSSTFKKGGGIIGGFFADLLLMLFGKWGTYIILGVLCLVLLILLTEKSFIKLLKKISGAFYKGANEVITHQKKNKVKKDKSIRKKEVPFTIENLDESTENIQEKSLKYASEDTSNMMSRVTLSEVAQSATVSEEEEVSEGTEAVVNEKEEKSAINPDKTTEESPLRLPEEKNPRDFTYEFPPTELLQKSKSQKGVHSKQQIIDNANKLQQTLENFGVKANILNVSCGPSVTRYEIQPEQGVKVSKIVNLADDIKLNLAAADIRIEAPIPGKAAVGIEVPNKENQMVFLRDIIESEGFNKHPSSLAFAIGKDIAGKEIVADIAKMPHLLIAGATGSGKSVCINTLITSLIYKAKPSEVKLIMIDPKMVELSVYNGIPHLMIPVVTDPKKASSALNWAVAEMTDRYKKFAEFNVRDIKGYNEKMKKENEAAVMPQVVIIVDELADLMMVAPGDVEDAICRLAQMARAAGIHLVIATQRPSVNVITGLIKANIPSRIAFSVSSGTDSRTILDMNGAEKLLGKGDMLFYPVGYSKPLRIQGAFISDKEVSNIVEFVKNNQEDLSYDENVMEEITNNTLSGKSIDKGEEKDEYFEEAIQLVLGKQKASISMIQRMFRVGFNRASRLMDQLHEAGIVGPDEGSKPRKVLMTQEEWENRENK